MTLPTRLQRAISTGVMLGLCSVSVLADADRDISHRDPGACEGHRDGPPPMRPGFGPPGPDDAGGREPPYLRGLELTDDQQDKVFAIMHEAAPMLRQQSKAARNAHDALRTLGQSAQFSTGAATQLAQSAGAAESQLALIHARIEHDIYVLLTVEQRKHLAERPPEHVRPPHDGAPF